MQNYVVDLVSEVGNSYRCQKAADSVNLKTDQKDRHHLEVGLDLKTPYNIGLIYGPSGSGKTTLAIQMFGNNFDAFEIDKDKCIIDQFPDDMEYASIVDSLTGMGLTSIPCWIRPFKTLSNGQQARAVAAIRMASAEELVVIDEWTSVVDRAVAKAMSLKIQKEARRKKKRVIILSCHYDIIEWLNPDWLVDCSTSEYKDRRLLVDGFEREEKLEFQISECKKKSWSFFSKYHYLSHNLAPKTDYTFGIYHDKKQIGFCAYTNYSLHDRRHLHSNRVVVHPDYIGFGLGIRMVTMTSKYLHSLGHRVSAKFTSIAMLKARLNHPNWKFVSKTKIDSSKKGAMGTLSRIGNKKRNDKKGMEAIKKQVAKRNESKLFFVVYYLFEYQD